MPETETPETETPEAKTPEIGRLRQEILALARTELSLEHDLPAGDLGESLDSVQRLTLVVAIEDHFAICFDPEDEEGASTLDEVVALVAKKRAELAR